MEAAPWDVNDPKVERYEPSRGPWFGLSQPYAYGTGRDSDLSTDSRLLLLAMGRADKYGHAEFSAGELERLLHKDRTTVGRALGKLRRAGLAAEESTDGCVWLVWEFRGGGHRPADARWGCAVHGRSGAASRNAAPADAVNTPIGLDLYRQAA
ncbi:hypothetical protein [Streptomyces chrestomyceticus]|uniref:hypothetical protein n=1 Tax=Streptomyces chrestomyceticus TaxID=68185 RepID=UPI0035A849E9